MADADTGRVAVSDGLTFVVDAPGGEALAFDRDGGRVAVAGRDDTVLIFDMAARAASTFHINTDADGAGPGVIQLLFSTAHPSELYAALADGSLQVLDVSHARAASGGTDCCIYRRHDGLAPAHSLSQSAGLLLVATRSAATLLSTDTFSRERSLPAPTSGIAAARLVPAALLLAIAFGDDTVIAYDAKSYAIVGKLTLPGAEAGAQLRTLAASPDGTLLVAGGSNGCVYVWDVPEERLLRVVDMPAPATAVLQVEVLHVPWTAAGASAPRPPPRLLLLGDDGRLLLVELGDDAVTALADFEAPLRSDGDGDDCRFTRFAVSPDGRFAAALVSDGRVCIYDLPLAVEARAGADAAAMAMDEVEVGGATTATASNSSSLRPRRPAAPFLSPFVSTAAAASTAGTSNASTARRAAAASEDGRERLSTAASSTATAGKGRPRTGSTASSRALSVDGEAPAVELVSHPLDPSAAAAVEEQWLRGASDHDGESTGGDALLEQVDRQPAADRSASTDGDESAPPSSLAVAAGDDAEDGEDTSHVGHGSARSNGWADTNRRLRVRGSSAESSAAVASVDILSPTTGKMTVSGIFRRRRRARRAGAPAAVDAEAATATVGADEGSGARSDDDYDDDEGDGGGQSTATRPFHMLVAAAGAMADARGGSSTAAAGTAGGEAVAVATHARLRVLLRRRGGIPPALRHNAWRLFLRLPCAATTAFRRLAAATPPSPTSGADSDLSSSPHIAQLPALLSLLCAWSPVLAHLPYLPSLAYPFLKFFAAGAGSAERGDGDGDAEEDEEASLSRQLSQAAAVEAPSPPLLLPFEAVAAILTNWSRHWAESLPHPPIHALARTHILLAFWDNPLAVHLEEVGASPIVYAWPMLKSAFSEALPRRVWELLWDAMFAHAHDPSLPLYAVVALLRCRRDALLAVPVSSQEAPAAAASDGEGGGASAVRAVVREPSASGDAAAAEGAAMLEMLYTMRASTPSWAHPYPLGERGGAGDSGGVPLPPLENTAAGAGAGIVGASDTGPLYPLQLVASASSGTTDDPALVDYAALDRYPRAVVELADAERARIRADAEATARKARLAGALTARSAALAAEEAAYRLEMALDEEAAARRSAAAAAASAARDRAAADADEALQQQRIDAVARMQDAAARALETARRRRANAAARAEAERLALDAARAAAVRDAVSDTALAALEAEAAVRLRAVAEERRREEEAEAAALRSQVAAARAVAALRRVGGGSRWGGADGNVDAAFNVPSGMSTATDTTVTGPWLKGSLDGGGDGASIAADTTTRVGEASVGTAANNAAAAARRHSHNSQVEDGRAPEVEHADLNTDEDVTDAGVDARAGEEVEVDAEAEEALHMMRLRAVALLELARRGMLPPLPGQQQQRASASIGGSTMSTTSTYRRPPPEAQQVAAPSRPASGFASTAVNNKRDAGTSASKPKAASPAAAAAQQAAAADPPRRPWVSSPAVEAHINPLAARQPRGAPVDAGTSPSLPVRTAVRSGNGRAHPWGGRAGAGGLLGLSTTATAGVAVAGAAGTGRRPLPRRDRTPQAVPPDTDRTGLSSPRGRRERHAIFSSSDSIGVGGPYDFDDRGSDGDALTTTTAELAHEPPPSTPSPRRTDSELAELRQRRAAVFERLFPGGSGSARGSPHAAARGERRSASRRSGVDGDATVHVQGSHFDAVAANAASPMTPVAVNSSARRRGLTASSPPPPPPHRSSLAAVRDGGRRGTAATPTQQLQRQPSAATFSSLNRIVAAATLTPRAGRHPQSSEEKLQLQLQAAAKAEAAYVAALDALLMMEGVTDASATPAQSFPPTSDAETLLRSRDEHRGHGTGGGGGGALRDAFFAAGDSIGDSGDGGGSEAPWRWAVDVAARRSWDGQGQNSAAMTRSSGAPHANPNPTTRFPSPPTPNASSTSPSPFVAGTASERGTSWVAPTAIAARHTVHADASRAINRGGDGTDSGGGVDVGTTQLREAAGDIDRASPSDDKDSAAPSDSTDSPDHRSITQRAATAAEMPRRQLPASDPSFGSPTTPVRQRTTTSTATREQSTASTESAAASPSRVVAPAATHTATPTASSPSRAAFPSATPSATPPSHQQRPWPGTPTNGTGDVLSYRGTPQSGRRHPGVVNVSSSPGAAKSPQTQESSLHHRAAAATEMTAETSQSATAAFLSLSAASATLNTTAASAARPGQASTSATAAPGSHSVDTAPALQGQSSPGRDDRFYVSPTATADDQGLNVGMSFSSSAQSVRNPPPDLTPGLSPAPRQQPLQRRLNQSGRRRAAQPPLRSHTAQGTSASPDMQPWVHTESPTMDAYAALSFAERSLIEEAQALRWELDAAAAHRAARWAAEEGVPPGLTPSSPSTRARGLEAASMTSPTSPLRRVNYNRLFGAANAAASGAADSFVSPPKLVAAVSRTGDGSGVASTSVPAPALVAPQYVDRRVDGATELEAVARRRAHRLHDESGGPVSPPALRGRNPLTLSNAARNRRLAALVGPALEPRARFEDGADGADASDHPDAAASSRADASAARATRGTHASVGGGVTFGSLLEGGGTWTSTPTLGSRRRPLFPGQLDREDSRPDVAAGDEYDDGSAGGQSDGAAPRRQGGRDRSVSDDRSTSLSVETLSTIGTAVTGVGLPPRHDDRV